MGSNDSKDKGQGLSSSSSSSSSSSTTMHVAGQITPVFVRKHFNIYNTSRYDGGNNSNSDISKQSNRPFLYNSRRSPSSRISASHSVGKEASVEEVVNDGLSNVLFLLQFACLDLRSTNYDKVMD